MDTKTKTLFYQIAELRHRAEWTYKIQLSQAECYHARNNYLNLGAIILTGISTLFATAGGITQLAECSQPWIPFIAAGLSGIGSILLACNKNLNYVNKIPENIELGAKIWRLYIDFESLLIGIFNDSITYNDAVIQREELLNRWTKLSEIAPLTFAEAVKLADKKINKDGDNKYSIEQLLETLPDFLRLANE